MKDLVKKQLEMLTTRLVERYFIEKNKDEVLSYLADQVTLLDAERDSVYRNKQDINDLIADDEDNHERYELLEILWIECTRSDQRSAVVMLKLKVQSFVTQKGMFLCFSLIWAMDEMGLWKIVHIHRSNLDNNSEVSFHTDIDHMTMINNLEGFVGMVNHLLEKKQEQRYAVIKFGIRDFRYINRRYGYRKGDMVLQNIAKNLQATCDEEETCGRIEKDTFAMLYKFKSRRMMAKRMDRVKEQLLDDDILSELGIEVKFIAGIYIVPKHDKEHVKNMLDKALLAMQSVRIRQQGSHYLYYEESLMEQQYMNSQIIESAHAALKREEFQLYIQPQFEVKTGKVIAGEALCRWEKEKGKFIPPNDFIPLFEDHGLILEFDFYMLRKLCEKMRQWIQTGSILTPISVNQSRLHIENKEYIKDFCKVVDHYCIPHSYIAFELTESAFVEQNDKMIELAKELHERGYLLAIDDFGTGYASLNLLSIISADILKVDKSLVDSIHTNRGRAVLEKVIELAHQMDMTVICEGVENMEQLKLLRALHCDTAQGFLMGKPIAADDFEKIWIKKNQERR